MVSASLNSLEFPTLVDIYLRFGFMDKGHGSNPKSFHSTTTNLHLSPRRKRLLKWTGLRRITLLRWLFTCWYRRRLTWIEQELFLTLLDGFSKQFYWAYTLQSQIKVHKMGIHKYLDWCSVGWTGSFKVPAKLDVEDLRCHLTDACKTLLLDQRASKGLLANTWFLRKLSTLVTAHRSEKAVRKVRRGRKLGHNDHGSLPQNQAARESDRLGGSLESEALLQNRLLYWLRNLLAP
jgi:hypothetical protein